MSEEQKPLETTVDNLESSQTRTEEINSNPLVDTSPESNPPLGETFSDGRTPSPQTATNLEIPTPEEIVASFQQEVAHLKQQLDEQTQQADTLKKRYISQAAEFDNFRKRTQKEKEELEVQVKRKTLSELLSVIDNFDRARTQIKPNNEGEMAIHKSYQGVYKNLVDGLKRLGVSAMRPEGQPFDPSYHEAMLREYTDDYPEGTVIEQLVRGYLLGDQVLRHAMVKVAAAKDPDRDPEFPEARYQASSEETSDSSSF